jgi:uncharacterized protein (DUF1015 family)
MASIRPFRGLRYSTLSAPIDQLVAPPYDVLSSAQRLSLAAQSEYNVVHLTLPEQKDDDRSKFVKYARSAARLAEWRRDGVLALEPQPAFYRYVQTFHIPGEPDPIVRVALIALIKTEPYAKGVVLPHEQTFPKHKEDRLRILEATRAHLECIFGLFEDEGGTIFRAITDAPVVSSIELEADDVHHRLEPITDPAKQAELQELLETRKVWIADGHHRYETACTFREALGEQPGPVAEDYMMMALSSMSDPGLVLLPTHRILNSLPILETELKSRLEADFEVVPTAPTGLFAAIAAVAEQGQRAFGLVLPSGGLVLKVRDLHSLVQQIEAEGSEQLNQLDVSILHRVILERIAGVKGLDTLAYTRDPEEAISAIDKGAAAAFLMNPPTVEDMRVIALGGEKMPQKSTYYYPKILSGLVLWSLNDFE